MVKINILLSDHEYRQAFIDRLQRSDVSIGAEVVTEIKSDYLYQDSLLVTDRALNSEERAMLNEKAIVYLTDECDDDSEILHLSKYSSMGDNIAVLSRIYSEVFNKSDIVMNGGSEVYAVCCTENGDGDVADLSRFIARQTAYIRHCKVLLLSLRDLNAFAYKGRESEFERLIYYLQNGRRIDVDSFFYRDDYGVFSLRTNEEFNQLTLMRTDEINWFLMELSNYFQVIVLHIGSSLTPDNQSRVCKSNLIFCADECQHVIRNLMPDIPLERVHQLKWNVNIEESEMIALDVLRNHFNSDVP